MVANKGARGNIGFNPIFPLAPFVAQTPESKDNPRIRSVAWPVDDSPIPPLLLEVGIARLTASAPILQKVAPQL